MIPKKVFSLWNTGVDGAPAVVQKAIASWHTHAPDYEINVLDGADLKKHLEELGLGGRTLTIQAASDILRTKLLFENGGVWLDATCLLTEPLDPWMRPAAQQVGFLAFVDPGPDRVIASWFLAAEKQSLLLERLLQASLEYWSKERKIFTGLQHIFKFDFFARRQRFRALKDPVWAVAPEGYGAKPFAPYFWFHYLFARLLETDDQVAYHWSRMPRLSPVLALAIGQCARNGDISVIEADFISRMRAASPIHKLNWRLEFPDTVMHEAARA